jgi:hypothetical protein
MIEKLDEEKQKETSEHPTVEMVSCLNPSISRE